MTLADGPLTSFLGACAAAAGSGVLLGGLAAGVTGVLLSWDRGELDYQVRKSGYWGGVVGLTALFADRVAL